MELCVTIFRTWAHRWHWFFFCLHPPVLKPNFYLTFAQFENARYFDASPSSQILISTEFSLQFRSLLPSIRLTRSFLFASDCWKRERGGRNVSFENKKRMNGHVKCGAGSCKSLNKNNSTLTITILGVCVAVGFEWCIQRIEWHLNGCLAWRLRWCVCDWAAYGMRCQWRGWGRWRCD